MKITEKQILSMINHLTVLARAEGSMLSEHGRDSVLDLLNQIHNQQSDIIKDVE